MLCPGQPDAAGATPVTANGPGSTPRLPAPTPGAFQAAPQHHRQMLYQHPPQSQSQPISSPAVASPPPIAAPPVHQSHVNSNAAPHAPRPAREKVRAQIACLICRRNKIKCENRGIHTDCENCIKGNKNCVYDQGSAPRPSQPRENTDGNVDPRSSKRRKTVASGPKDHPHPHSFISIHDRDNPLASDLLTIKVWKELLEIYEQHFASDFPFLHRLRFLRSVQSRPRYASPAAKNTSHSAHVDAVLLGFLCLTARHHGELLRVFQRKPKEVAEYFASHTQRLLEPILAPGAATLERIQALLFLGFHRWTDLKGATGYDYIGIAGRWAHRLKLHKLDKRIITGPVRRPSSASRSLQDQLIDREIERRTYWSCFILDRFSGCLEDRPHSINVSEIETQLPCSDSVFHHGSKVKTRQLLENDAEYLKRRRAEEEHAKQCAKTRTNGQQIVWQVDETESQLVSYIQAVNHFGKVMNWANRSGRRQEIHDPWHEDSGFRKLEVEHDELKSALPAHTTLTAKNTEEYALLQKSCTYVSIHAIHSLCAIALYREYMAFAPWGRDGPVGPLDEPKLSGHPIDPDYWIKQARKCFGAAKEYKELLKACQKASSLTESPIVAWTTYTVAWCVTYVHYFEKMDPDRVLFSDGQASYQSLVNSIYPMIDRYAMTGTNATSLVRLNEYYRKNRIKWRRAGGASPDSTLSDGGLHDYITEGFEQGHKGMGSPDDTNFDQKIDRAELTLGSCSETDARSEATSPINFKHEETPASTPDSAGCPTTYRRGHAKAKSESGPSLPSVHDLPAGPAFRMYNTSYDPSRTLPPIMNPIAAMMTVGNSMDSPAQMHSGHAHPYHDRFQVRSNERHSTLGQIQPIYPAEHDSSLQEQMMQEGQNSWRSDDIHWIMRGGVEEAHDIGAWMHDIEAYVPEQSAFDYSAVLEGTAAFEDECMPSDELDCNNELVAPSSRTNELSNGRVP